MVERPELGKIFRTQLVTVLVTILNFFFLF